MTANGHKFYTSLCSEIFQNLFVRIHGYQFYSFLGVLCFKPIPKYFNVWYEGNLQISQWSDTGPSWPSCKNLSNDQDKPSPSISGENTDTC